MEKKDLKLSEKAILINISMIASDEIMEKHSKTMLPIVELLYHSYSTMTTVWDGTYRIIPIELIGDLMQMYHMTKNALKKINTKVRLSFSFMPIPDASHFDTLISDKGTIKSIRDTFNDTLNKRRKNSIMETKKRLNSIYAGIIRELEYADEEPIMLQEVVKLAIDELPILNVYNDIEITEKVRALHDIFQGYTDHILNNDKSKRDELFSKVKALNLEK